MRTIPKRSLNRNKIIIKELEQFFPKVHYQEDLEHLEEGPIMKKPKKIVHDKPKELSDEVNYAMLWQPLMLLKAELPFFCGT